MSQTDDTVLLDSHIAEHVSNQVEPANHPMPIKGQNKKKKMIHTFPYILFVVSLLILGLYLLFFKS